MIDSASITHLAGDELAALQAALGTSLPGLARLLLEHCSRTATPLAVKAIGSGRYVWANDAMAGLLGRPPRDVVGRDDGQLLPGLPATLLHGAEQAALADPRGAVSEHRLEGPAGVREFSVLRLPLSAADQLEPRYLAALWSDLGEVRSGAARLAAALGQIEDQQRAYEALRREIDLSSREHREFALVIVTLDRVAAGAERGAEAQQRVVEALARQLRGRTRAMDASCRLGEERFAVLLSGVGLATAHARMESLRRQCASEIVVQDGCDFSFTVSMGVASFPHTADSHELLLAAAEQALIEAGRRGGNQVALASIRFDTA